jgi:hypothetical protein
MPDLIGAIIIVPSVAVIGSGALDWYLFHPDTFCGENGDGWDNDDKIGITKDRVPTSPSKLLAWT